MRVLVIGGAGYIGGALTDELVKQNIPFTVYDNLLYEDRYLKPVDFIYGDIRDAKKLKKVLPKFTHLVLLAAIVGDAACQIKPVLTVTVNQNSAEWLAKNFKGRIIFTSTCSVYGRHDGLLTELSPVNPLSLYAETKLHAEQFLKTNNALIFRIGTAFGLSDTYSRLRMDLVLNYMTASAVSKGKLTVYGGNQWRPLIHVKDIAATIANNLEKSTRGIYNLASTNIQIKNLAETVAKITNCDIEYLSSKLADQRDYHVSVEKAERDHVLPNKHWRTISDGIQEIYGLIKSGRIKYTENDIYFNERHISNLLKNGQFD